MSDIRPYQSLRTCLLTERYAQVEMHQAMNVQRKLGGGGTTSIVSLILRASSELDPSLTVPSDSSTDDESQELTRLSSEEAAMWLLPWCGVDALTRLQAVEASELIGSDKGKLK